MKRIAWMAAVTAFVASLAYALSPFATGWMIREAAISGDTAYLTKKIEWVSVKTTLGPSLIAFALDVPPDDAPPAGASLWTRLKSSIARPAVASLVDSYMTAENLPKLFAYRRTYNAAIGASDEPKTLANLPLRLVRFTRRITSARFASLTRVEAELIDKNVDTRRYAVTLEFFGFQGWKVTELRVLASPITLSSSGLGKQNRYNVAIINQYRAWPWDHVQHA